MFDPITLGVLTIAICGNILIGVLVILTRPRNVTEGPLIEELENLLGQLGFGSVEEAVGYCRLRDVLFSLDVLKNIDRIDARKDACSYRC